MTTIDIYCIGNSVTAKASGAIPAGTHGIKVFFHYSEEWEALAKTFAAKTSDENVKTVTPVTDEAILPWEVLEEGMRLLVGMEGRSEDGGLVFPTTWAECGKVQASTFGCHDESVPPTPSEIEQVITVAGIAKQKAEKAEVDAAEALDTVKSINAGNDAIFDAAVGDGYYPYDLASDFAPGKTFKAEDGTLAKTEYSYSGVCLTYFRTLPGANVLNVGEQKHTSGNLYRFSAYWFDENKEYLSYSEARDGGTILIAPEKARYVRIRVWCGGSSGVVITVDDAKAVRIVTDTLIRSAKNAGEAAAAALEKAAHAEDAAGKTETAFRKHLDGLEIKTDNKDVLPASEDNKQSVFKRIRVASYNVAQFSMYSGGEREEYIANIPGKVENFKSWLSHAAADYLLLQEYSTYIDAISTAAGGKMNTNDCLLRTKYPYQIGGSGNGSERIFASKGTRKSTAYSGTVNLDILGGTGYTSKFHYSWVILDHDGKKILFASVHLTNSSLKFPYAPGATKGAADQRQYEVQQIFDKVKSLEWDYAIIGGDFNTSNMNGKNEAGEFIPAGTTDYDNLKAACDANGFRMVNGGYNGWFCSRPSPSYDGCLDNILVSNNIRIVDVECDPNWDDLLYSDHRPVVAELELLENYQNPVDRAEFNTLKDDLSQLRQELVGVSDLADAVSEVIG